MNIEMPINTKKYYLLRRITEGYDGDKKSSWVGRGHSVDDCIDNAVCSDELDMRDYRSDASVSYEVFEVPANVTSVKTVSAEEVTQLRKGKKAKEEKEAQTADEEQ